MNTTFSKWRQTALKNTFETHRVIPHMPWSSFTHMGLDLSMFNDIFAKGNSILYTNQSVYTAFTAPVGFYWNLSWTANHFQNSKDRLLTSFFFNNLCICWNPREIERDKDVGQLNIWGNFQNQLSPVVVCLLSIWPRWFVGNLGLGFIRPY